jgi:heme exporter protein D
MNEFFAMGGYAAYVWPAYAISLLALSGLAYFTLRRGRRLRRRLEQAENSRKASADEPSA